MRVVIVGAGPTGAALSFLLARRGIDVELLEREDRFDRIFRGEALMPGGVEAIEQMGLGEKFNRLPRRTVECAELFIGGTRIIRADWPEVAGKNAAQVVSQPALIEMFIDAARQYSNFKLRMDATIRDVRATDNGVEAEVQSDNGSSVLRGDVIIGADGRGSLVRSRLGLKLERSPFPFDVTWFSTPMPPSQLSDPRFQSFSRDHRVAVLYPSWDNRLRVGLSVPVREASQLSSTAKEQLLDMLGAITGEPYKSFFRDHADQVSQPTTLKVLFGRCPQWSSSRALLLGDAAHPMSPVRAQGINLALRDAIVAANHLVPACASGKIERFDEAARRIQAEREPEIVESQRLQMLATEPPPPFRSPIFRALVLPVLRQFGVVKRTFLKSEIPMRHGLAPVRLSV